MRRRHTTGPIQPIRPIPAVSPVAIDRRGVPAQAMLQRSLRFYRRRLRLLAGKARPEGADKEV
jgi:hypothetical protein